jgi:chorismate synthase
LLLFFSLCYNFFVMLRFLTAGESHGPALTAIIEGLPAGLSLSVPDINADLARRQGGLGRGGRMKIEKDKVQILSGVRLGKTIGSPLSLLIPNKSIAFFNKSFYQLRPGHADLAGALKYNEKDLRNILERASARETAVRVAVGAVAKKLLKVFGVNIDSRVLELGGSEDKNNWPRLVEQARKNGDSLGGIFEVTAKGVPVGLGSHVHWDRRLDGNLARAVMAIPAIKGVEIGLGFAASFLPGSQVQDEIHYRRGKGFSRPTNNAGGLEGGITNGEPIVIRAAMKPIATIARPLPSVDMKSKKAVPALVERADLCAVEAAGVIGEAAVAWELASAFLEKFGADSLAELQSNFTSYQKRLAVI